MLDRFFPKRQYRRQYAEYLIYHHRSFDVKGLTTQGVYTLELAQVFVELGLGMQSVNQASTDPIRPMPAPLRKGRHNVWAYLTSDKIAGQTLVFLGPPGSGKTTLLKHLAISLAPQKPNLQVTQNYNHLPILLFLRDHAKEIVKNPRYSIIQAIQASLKKWEIDIPSEWFKEHLKKGQCLIMLDGLDEVADMQMRQHVVTWVERQMALLAKNHFVVTSRPFGYQNNPLAKAVVLEVQPFSIDQVTQFVHNWYMANEIMSSQRDDPGVRMEAKTGADDLLFRLRRTHVLLDLAVNPLLLTMIATVHRYRSSLPGRRVELYDEICEVFLGKRQQARGIVFDLTPAQKQRVLQPLAYHMMCQNKREITLDEAVETVLPPLKRVSPQTPGELFLQMIVNSSGLLVEREAGLYSFAHLTFQEYLTAVHIQDQRLEETLISHVEDSWWHESIRLYAAQVDATNIVRACLARRTASIQALTLAMECLEEAREVTAELRNIFDRLAQSVDHPNPGIRQISAEVRLTLRTRRMIRVDDDRYFDNSFITNAEYQLFIDDERRVNRYHQPDHWDGYEFVTGHGRLPVAGVRPIDAVAFCQWMSERDPGEWHYRLPKSNEVAMLASNAPIEDPTETMLAHWFSSARGIESAKVDLAASLQIEPLLLQMQDRFNEDWHAHKGLKYQTQARDLVLSRVRYRQFKLQDMDRNLNLSRMQDPDVVRDVNIVRNRELLSWARMMEERLQFRLAQAQDPEIERARELSLDELLIITHRLSDGLAHAQDLESAPELARMLLRSLERAHAHSLNKESVFQPELIRALTTSHGLANELILTLGQARAQARSRVRTNSLFFVNELLKQSESPRSGQTRPREQARLLLGTYIDLYLDFVLLDARIGQKLPALEGIRVVKERKQPVASD
ncbi:MAG: NACHT domain-containing protein [Chloroflexi bacterium]|nr:NACHT domain-containing protein [Chloroflexota bacterium]